MAKKITHCPCRKMFGQKRVNSETFARALKIFGPKELVNLVSLMGYYAATAALLIAFDMQLDENQEAPLPPVFNPSLEIQKP